MGLLDRLGQLLLHGKAVETRSPATIWRMLGAEGEGQQQDYGTVANQSRAYKASSTVFFCVRQKANTASAYRYQVKQRQADSEDLEGVPNHPFEMLLQRPNEHTTRQELLVWTFSFLSLTGNAYWLLEFVDGEPVRIIRLRPDRVSVIPDKREYIAGYTYHVNGKDVKLEPWEVVHFKTFNPTGDWYGLSDIAAHSMELEGDIHATKAFNAELKNRGVPPTVVTLETALSGERFDEFKREWRRNYSGYDNTGKTGFLNGSDVNVKTLAIPSRDLQRLETREYTADMIKQAHGVPLGLYSRNATEANALAAYRTFLRDTIRPMHALVGETITAQILLPFYAEDLVGEFESCVLDDEEPRLREMEIIAQGAMGSGGVRKPILTVDEYRARYLEMEPFPEEEFPDPIMPSEPEPQPPQDSDGGDVEEEPERDVLDDGAEEAEEKRLELAADKMAGDDMRKWRTVAIKEFLAERDPSGRVFRTKWIDTATQDAVYQGLASSQTLEQVKAVFDDPFAVAIKAKYPDRYDERKKVERKVGRELRKALEAQQKRVIQQVRIGNVNAAQDTNFWKAERGTQSEFGRFAKDVNTILKDVILKAAEQALDDTEEQIMGVGKAIDQDKLQFTVPDGDDDPIMAGLDWSLINADAANWAREYVYELVTSLDDNTRKLLQSAISEWIEQSEPIDALPDRLEAAFGRRRAEMIAVTEVTRAYAEANAYIWQKSGLVKKRRWQTAMDERVCPVCGPLHGQETEWGKEFDGGIMNPPAHPRCRCWVVPVVD